MDASQTILVTGASGFVGRRFLEMVPPHWAVHAVWRSREDFPDFVAALENPRIVAHRCDLADAAAVQTLARTIGSDALMGLLVLSANGDPVRSEADPLLDLTETAVTAINVFRSFTARRLVYLSSGAVYEGARGVVSPAQALDLRLPYAITHYAAERYGAWAAGQGRFPHAVLLRFWGAFGPHEPERKIYTRLIRNFALERRRAMTLRGDGTNLIDAMYVDDAVRALQAVFAAPPATGVETFDFSSGEPTSILALARLVAETFGVADPEFHFEGTVAENHEFRADPAPFRRRFGFRPRFTTPEGLQALHAWLCKESTKVGRKSRP